MNKIRKWLQDNKLLSECGNYISINGPTEIAIRGQKWQLSDEGRSDDGPRYSGTGLDSLVKAINDLGRSN